MLALVGWLPETCPGYPKTNLVSLGRMKIVVPKKQSHKAKAPRAMAPRTMAPRPKMRDVAELAGVSLQTVSNFVNDRHDQMNEQTLAKVSKAMEKLNYRPNVAAASLRSQRTKTIAYLILDQNSAFLEDPLTSQHLAGVAEVADERGYGILVQSGRPNQIDEESLAPLLEGRFDGAIIQLSGKPKLRKKSAEMALSSGLPSVILDEVGLSPGQLGVRADQEQGAFEITQHLINLGHVRIGFIATAAPWAVIEQRYKGFQKAMRQAGIEVVPEHVLLEAVYMAIDGEQLALRLLQMKKPPTAFMCTSDLLAAGVMRAVRSLNLEIPRDIAVTGFDNFAFSQYLQPSLSTVKIPVYEMGRMAANMLIDVIEGIELTKNLAVFSTEIIIRESS